MSLNNIELGDLIVSELYRDTLLATEARPGTGPSAKTAPSPAADPSQSVPRPAAANMPAPGSPIAPDVPANPVTRTSAIPPAPETRSPASSPLVSTPPASAPGTGSPVTNAPATPGTSAPAPAPGTTTPGYKFLGNNRRKITILVQSPGSAFLPDDQLAFLTKMLEACRMNIGDVAIVNQATAPVNITVLKQQLQPAILLLFGMEPVAIKLPMNFPVFKIQEYDACTYLSAPSLEDLVRPGDENKLLKSKLWMCLKTIFEI